VLWRYDHVSVTTSTNAYAGALYVDGAGDAYAVGATDYADALLVKLSGASGAELWTRKYRKTLFGAPVPDLAGDLVVAGSRGWRLAVMKLSKADGRKLWRRTLRGNSYNGAYASAVALDGDGDVVASGAIVTPLPRKVNGFPSYTVLKACGKNGRIRNTDVLCP
jgi:outer membrane protein assembly factor BamB